MSKETKERSGPAPTSVTVTHPADGGGGEVKISPEHIEELHQETLKLRDQIASLHQRINEVKIRVKRAEAAIEEISGVESGKGVYQAVARMFVLRSKEDLLENLRKQKTSAEADLPKLEKLEEEMQARLAKTEAEKAVEEQKFLEVFKAMMAQEAAAKSKAK
eukprot:GHVN01021430.1.p1 GENE.GHVN01021430.1~~GHVN01021430.1.p1  ORF type:complete len:162 (-),score=49.70 GHVN01021430.1:44-529(-)